MLSRRKRYEAECFFGDKTEQFICCPVPVIVRLFQSLRFQGANVLHLIFSHAVIVCVCM